jgi:hypothetical protein
LALAITALFFGSAAHAALLVEPYAGYAFGGTIKNGGFASSDTITGVEYGARLGFQKMGFMIGAEYLGGNMDFKDSGTTYHVGQTDIGPFIGYQSLLGFRIFASYFISPTASTNTSPTEKFTSGWGAKIGVGYKVLQYMAVNLEYYSSQFSKDQVSGVTATLNPKLQASYYMLTLSFPLTFL